MLCKFLLVSGITHCTSCQVAFGWGDPIGNWMVACCSVVFPPFLWAGRNFCCLILWVHLFDYFIIVCSFIRGSVCIFCEICGKCFTSRLIHYIYIYKTCFFVHMFFFSVILQFNDIFQSQYRLSIWMPALANNGAKAT